MPPVFVNSIPKSGTHLLERALSLMGASTQVPLFLSSAAAGNYPPGADETVLVGVGMPVLVSARLLRQALAGLAPGQVVTGHVPYSPPLEKLLRELGFRMILIVRDPRDVAVSLAHHIAREPRHRLHASFAKLSPDDRILRAITGVRGDGDEQLDDIYRRYHAVLPWLGSGLCLLVRFEDLVGQKGGGSDERQRAILLEIGSALGLDQPDLPLIQRDLFGHGVTFRQGLIGQWRQQFAAVHEEAFTRVAGPLLSELGYC